MLRFAPGQACVFYNTREGQSRVLGGGFIRGTGAVAQASPGSARGDIVMARA